MWKFSKTKKTQTIDTADFSVNLMSLYMAKPKITSNLYTINCFDKNK